MPGWESLSKQIQRPMIIRSWQGAKNNRKQKRKSLGAGTVVDKKNNEVI